MAGPGGQPPASSERENPCPRAAPVASCLSGAARPAVPIPTLLRACVPPFSAMPRPLHPGCRRTQTHTPNSKSHATCTRAHTRPHNAPHLYPPPSHQHVHVDADTRTPIHTHTHSPGGSPSPGALSVPPPYMSSLWWCWRLYYCMYVSCAQPFKLTVSHSCMTDTGPVSTGVVPPCV